MNSIGKVREDLAPYYSDAEWAILGWNANASYQVSYSSVPGRVMCEIEGDWRDLYASSPEQAIYRVIKFLKQRWYAISRIGQTAALYAWRRDTDTPTIVSEPGFLSQFGLVSVAPEQIAAWCPKSN